MPTIPEYLHLSFLFHTQHANIWILLQEATPAMNKTIKIPFTTHPPWINDTMTVPLHPFLTPD